jgi:chemotaxis protein CheD
MQAGNTALKHVQGEKPREQRVHVFQGHFEVSNNAEVFFATILGSCVAVCMRDPVAGIGGMNHFLVPGDQREDTKNLSYGVHSMELLINGMLKMGAKRNRLEAKLFGGAKVIAGVIDIGVANANFAREFLLKEHIPCLGESLGGNSARRLHFWPVNGRARQLLVPIDAAPPIKPVEPPKPADDGNDIEFF